MNLPDKIYKEWVEEIYKLGITADTPVAKVFEELTRALKRVTNNNGGTAYTADGVGYNIKDEVVSNVQL